MTSKFSIDNRELLQRISSGEAVVGIDFGNLIVRELAAFRLAAMGSEPHTDDELSNLLWYSQEATCHSDQNYYCEFQRLATPGLIAGIIRELQERRKADSEPVGYFGRFDPDDEDLIDQCSKNVKGAFPPYRHAQPAPVVPDERDKAVDADDHPLLWSFNEGWNACRAAMLAAAPQSPGSEPAAVPGKWIPVSERMPEVGDIVLTAMGGAVNVGEMECSAANCRFFTSVISGRELPATHWMPLPAGPQEVK